MVIPWTHLVKNNESLSLANEFPSKKNNPEIEILGSLSNLTVNLKTDSKTLY